MVSKVRLYFLVLFLVLLDQITKFYIDGIRNYYAAFGIKINMFIIIIISILVISACVYYLNKTKNNYINFGLLFVLSGSFGNLIDRIVFGYVRDFISLWVWPGFNFADVYNVIGVGLLLIYLVKDFLQKH